MPEQAVDSQPKGRLKIFLGFAPGTGKTYAMLDEAQRRKGRGQDVVLASVDSRGRSSTREEMEGIEQVPTLPGGQIDVPSILARRPDVAVIDDLHRSNPEGSQNPKRWQDIQQVLEAGINVLTTMNIYHLESLQNAVEDISGLSFPDTVPDTVFRGAEEIEMCDATPRALINRFDRGEIFPLDDAGPLAKLYDEGILSAFRELAFREAAGRIDDDVMEARREKKVERPWATQDKVLICVTATRRQFRLIRRGWRVAQRVHGQAVAVHVEDKPHSEHEERILADDFKLAQALGIPTVRLKGPIAATLIQYVQENNITELVIGHSRKTKLQELTRGSIVQEIARELKTVDILIVAVDEPAPADHA